MLGFCGMWGILESNQVTMKITGLQPAAVANAAHSPKNGLAPPTRTEILYAPNVVTYQLAQCESYSDGTPSLS